ncbi:MAG: septum formation protein Maf [Burkholderiales bacterium]|nr:septum formation protein Maf [Burkholderiales bacterium]
MIFSDGPKLVLASASRYRRALLDQLRLAYSVCPPAIDETPREGERPRALAERLAREKACAVARRHAGALVIGSDQVATLDDLSAFSKPADHADALAQLTRMSGQTVVFHTAVCVYNTRTQRERHAIVPTEVRFRALDPEMIDAYLRLDQPYDCAGSAKIESLGIALVERVRSDDPSALLGLPLIALVDLLAAEGLPVL